MSGFDAAAFETLFWLQMMCLMMICLNALGARAYLCRPLYFAMYGCDGFGEGHDTYVESVGILEDEPCDSEPMPVTAFCFFAFFIFVAGFLMLNLFIGVILVMLQNVTGRFPTSGHD